MPERFTLFVVEDDAALREMLGDYLSQQGFDVQLFASGPALRAAMATRRPDLIVLDVMLPGESGLEVCARLRAARDRTPILLLTARSEVIERIIGLESGADDFVGKPFVARELLARIRSLLRRSSPENAQSDAHDRTHPIGDYVFVPSARALLPARPGGAMQALGSTEYSILKHLIDNPRVSISRRRLLQACHTRSAQTTERCVDVNIARLRRMLEPDSERPRFIQTVRGHGYMFVPSGPGRGEA